MRAALPVILLMAAACTPQTAGSVRVAPGDTLRQGTVRVVGSAPRNVFVTVQEENGRSTYVTGPLTGEIRNLSGARVEIAGRMQDGHLAATGYRILAVDGRPVEMGTVERASDGGMQLRQADGRVVRLTGATAQLRVGQKVWVQGPTTATVQVQSYGVITP
jgi:hypothetical protein